ncbi:MAG: sensor histidine kinase [Methylobacillus sp.]|jgi:two-component system sensor histidine kinase RegB|nr:sensor histidine kinase [Methylobacillus sp.]
MISAPLPSSNAALKNLRRIFVLRNVVIVFLSATILALVWFSIPVPWLPVLVSIGAMLLLNGWTWWRLKSAAPVSDRLLFAQLLGDIAALTLLFYFTGGYSNPLVWMYLLPIAVAAVALPLRLMWSATALAMASYAALVFFHAPLSHLHVNDLVGIGLDTHLAGMWLGFTVSAVLVAGFVSRIGQNLRDNDRLVAEAREQMLESERMLALGALAAATAHELGTPLATINVLVGELHDTAPPELAADFKLLRGEVARCKEILSSLAASAGQIRGENAHRVALDVFLEETLQRWRDTRPALQFDCRLSGTTPAPQIVADRTLGQALVNLLDNAADASPDRVEMQGVWNRNELHITIRDHGHGLAPEIAAQAGQPFFTTKTESGMGIGLYLARTIFSRFGGHVELENQTEGGTVTRIHLPLADLIVEEK